MKNVRCPTCKTLNAKQEGNKIILLVGYGKRRRFLIFEPIGASLQCLECKNIFHLDERRKNETFRESGSNQTEFIAGGVAGYNS